MSSDAHVAAPGRGTGGPTVYSEYHAPFNPWLIAIVATMATFMEVLDTTIVNVALPHIAGSMGSDVQESTWVLTAYLVSNAVVLTISAWLSSVFGRRNYYLGCVTLFALSSLMCGLSTSMPMLVFFRLLQGVGGGGLQPSTQAILVDTFPPERRGMGMAVFGMTVVVAPILGPTLGGWITDNYSWRWIFFINLPVGALSLLLASKLITDPPYLKRRHGPHKWRFDYFGLALLCIGLGSLQVLLDLGQRYDWFASRLITGLTITSVVALILVVIWELYTKDPIINLRLLGERNLGSAVLTMLIFGAVLYSSTVMLPLFMQTLLGYTAMLSGLAISPGGIVVFFMMPFIGWMVSRFDARKMLGFGTLIVAFSLYYMGRFDLQVNFMTIVIARLIQSFGLAFFFVPVNTVAYAYVPPEERNGASSLMNVARNIGGSVGISFVTTETTRLAQVHQNYLVSHISAYSITAQDMLHRLTANFLAVSGDPVRATHEAYAAMYAMLNQQARTMAYVDLFHYLAIAALAIIPLMFLIRKPERTNGGVPVH